ncbi:Smr/MutS family protein [Rubrivirga sp. IMCC45206]|uniref:Smr/MutS family protein n=1 Tax=Rubrivirga sp. IMCC45206 TaxID=3391614 RepID=UPI00399012A5
MPRLADDGRTVTLDLHGASVADALDLADRAVEAAALRGRPTLRIVHGTSTADAGAHRTIKSALHAALDRGDFPEVASAFRHDGAVLLALRPDPAPRAGRLSLADIW